MAKICKKRSLRLYIYLILCIFALAFVLKTIDDRLMPTARELAYDYAATYINGEIDRIASDLIDSLSLRYTDFYDTEEKDGEISSVFVNSILVNSLCQKMAANLSASLNNSKTQELPLPLGLATGIKLLSNYGPKINLRLIPSGNATVDYETSLSDAGINRVNYRICLNIKTSVRLVSPLSSAPLEITRKYMLVDTVFSGSVPDTYLNLSPNR